MYIFDDKEAYSINNDVSAFTFLSSDGKNKIKVVDDFFTYPGRVRELVQQTPAPKMWRRNPENGKYYNDNRQEIHHKKSLDVESINRLLWDYGERLDGLNHHSTNIFREIDLSGSEFENKIPSPHMDPWYTLIVYLNTEEEIGEDGCGGTSFFINKNNGQDHYQHLNNTEESVEYYSDVEDYANCGLRRAIEITEYDKPSVQNATQNSKTLFRKEFDETERYDYFVDSEPWEAYKTIPMKYNRAILYPGKLWHAHSHVPGKFVDENWRMNMAFFLKTYPING